MHEPLKIEKDDESGIITIEGVKFRYEFFKHFGNELTLPLNKPFMITERKDGVVILERLTEREGFKINESH